MMISSLEQPKHRFKAICIGLEFLPSLLPLLMVAAYLIGVAGFSGSGAVAIGAAAIGVGSVFGFGGWFRRRHDREVVDAVLNSETSRDESEPKQQDLEAALLITSRWPGEMQRERLVSMLLLLLLIPLILRLLGIGSGFGISFLVSFLLSGLAASLLAAGVQYFGTRAMMRRFSAQLSAQGNEPLEHFALPVGYSMTVVMGFAIIIPVVSLMLASIDYASHQARASAEDEALRWCQVAINDVLSMNSESEISSRIESQWGAQRHWPFPVDLRYVSDFHRTDVIEDGLSPRFTKLLSKALESDDREGDLLAFGSAEMGRYTRLDQDAMILATVQRRDLPRVYVLGRGMGALLIVTILAGVMMWSKLVTRDLEQAIGRLADKAKRLAAGDLRPMAQEETEIELAAAEDSLRRAQAGMRETVLEVREALDTASSLIGGTSESIAQLRNGGEDQSHRIAKMSELVGELTAGTSRLNASAESISESVDESDRSAAELGAASGELGQTALVLSSQVDEVSGSAEHMFQSAQKVGDMTGRLATTSEDTSSSLENMASAMGMIDASVESMGSLSRDVVEKAEAGQEKVRQTMVGMEAIRDATYAAEQVIRGLGTRTSEIGGILDVIEDVADETNLLALNAAIIAAQAGEQGKAFSVVADQIKELADRVLASTKEIDGLIRAVQEESENAIGAIAAGSESVMSGVDLSAEAGRTLEDITEASRETGNRIDEIVASVREQTTAARDVVSLVERVRESADEIHAASDEQRHGNDVICRSAITIRKVVQQVHRTTGEQADGFEQIRKSMAGGRSEIDSIRVALQRHSGACGEAAGFLEETFEGTRSQAEVSVLLGQKTGKLFETIEALREEMERFSIL